MNRFMYGRKFFTKIMATERFPVVKAKGSHYGVGFSIGRQFKLIIAEYLGQQHQQLGKGFAVAIAESAIHLAQVVRYFPAYIEELEGIASGAGVPFVELFLANDREIFGLGPQSTRCTIVGVARNKGYLLGHNEDWLPGAGKYLYILDAEIEGMKIWGLNYCYELVGGAVAMNGHGLIQAVNELLHYDGIGRSLGVPKNFIARAILDCRTLEEAERIIVTIPRAGGFNHVVVIGSRLWNFETSARKFATEKISDRSYVHTNHYLTASLKGLDRGTRESKERLAKAQSLLGQTKTTIDMMRLLSNRATPAICRDNTIGSIVIDAPGGAIYVAVGQPTPDSYYQIKI